MCPDTARHDLVCVADEAAEVTLGARENLVEQQPRRFTPRIAAPPDSRAWLSRPLGSPDRCYPCPELHRERRVRSLSTTVVAFVFEATR